jgi:hypothetical protein
LEKTLVETNISNDLEVCKFEAMVGHLITPHYLSSFEYDDVSLSHPHIAALHIKVQIQKNHVKRVLIDGGAELSICTLKLIQALCFFEQAIEFKINSMNPQQISITYPHPHFDKGNHPSTSYSSPSYSNPYQPSTSTYRFTTSQFTIPSIKNTLIKDVQGQLAKELVRIQDEGK